jgi:DNA-binding NarL/FixJ family response regulator
MKETGEYVPSGRIRVMIVDDYGAWRSAIHSILKSQPDLQVIAEALDGVEAVEKAVQTSPDIILMDIGLPGLNGIEAARRIRHVSPASKILFFSEYRSPDIAQEALRTGGSGYVVKSAAGKELEPALRAIVAGGRFISPMIADPDPANAARGESESEDSKDSNPYTKFASSATNQEFLSSVIRAASADFGNMRIFDSVNCVLRIVAQIGFQNEFLDSFEAIGYRRDCACSKAAIERARIVVIDVSTDPIFSRQTREALLRARIRSMQATPLISSSQRLIGVVSTHYARCGGPSANALAEVDDLTSGFLTSINA